VSTDGWRSSRRGDDYMQRSQQKRRRFCALLSILTVTAACSLTPPPRSDLAADGTQPSPSIRTLPFRGTLIDGVPDDLPPSVAASLDPKASITFAYREVLTHNDYHIPLWFSALDPVTYVGAPLGDYGATATATLTIAEGPRTLGTYFARAYVSKSY